MHFFILLILFINFSYSICTYKTQGVDGNDCWSLASACGFDLSNSPDASSFYGYNPTLNTDCSNLFPKQRVCCNAGGLAPSTNADNSCFTYNVTTGDTCGSIGGKYGLSKDQLNLYNQQTWMWFGCDNLQTGLICLSPGTPPRPTPNPTAQCGPLAPDTLYNTTCPLNACCSAYGYCGITQEFCQTKQSLTNAPGTTGCLSNCDIKYIQGEAPASLIHVGYYESWNQGWSCSNARLTDIDLSNYTHIHYAFSDIDSNFNIMMDNFARDQFEDFKALSNVKKIISVGGWGVSTSPNTYQHLRYVVDNADTASTQIAKFVEDNQLDGIDFDWEYPGATDIPGISGGLATDGQNYLSFLKLLRQKLASDKSISIAAPASYWYLKNFPIADISKVVDYIVFMTYDLHGQWDYGSQWTGNYLRSHVNITETQQALALITHAGVSSSKVLLGLAKYGRSFQQTDPNCYGPDCFFTGPASGAIKGKCTNTAGYMGLAEIKELISTETIRQHYEDEGSQILVWGQDQWMAYLTDEQLAARKSMATQLNLGGTITWAIDLDAKSNCDISNIYTYTDLISSVCAKSTISHALISRVSKAIAYWNSSSIYYDKGVQLLQEKFNVTDMPSQADYNNFFTYLTNFINNLGSLDKIDDDTYALLFFYGKRSSIFTSIVNNTNSVSRRSLLFSSFGYETGLADAYIPLQTFEEGAIAAAPLEETAIIGGSMISDLALVFPVVAVAAVGIITSRVIEAWNQNLQPVPDVIMKNIQANKDYIDKVIALATNPHSISNIPATVENLDNIELDAEPEDAVIPGSSTPHVQTVMFVSSLYVWFPPNLFGNGMIDPRTSIMNYLNLVLRGFLTDPDDPRVKQGGIPVYWINISGNSPGVACNAWKYFSKKALEAANFNNANRNMPILPDTFNLFTRKIPTKERRYYINKYSCAFPGVAPRILPGGGTRAYYEREEFPPASVNEGEITVRQEYDVSVNCVEWDDNEADGTSIGNFYRNAGLHTPYNDPILGSASGFRTGPIQNNEAFLIKINNLPDPHTCAQTIFYPLLTTNYANVINRFYDHAIP